MRTEKPGLDHAYAAHLWSEGENDKAITYIMEASRVFPAIRAEMTEDPALALFFVGGDLP